MVDFRPHISLNPLPNQPALRRRRGFGTTPPERDNVEYSRKIIADIETARREYTQQNAETPPAIRPVLVVKIDAENQLPEATLRRNKLTLLEENKNNRIYALVEDNFDELESRATEYGEPRVRGNPKYNSLFANINSIGGMSIDERLSERVRSADIDPALDYTFDIRFWYFDSAEDRDTVLELLRDYVGVDNVLDTYNRNAVLMARIRVAGARVEQLFADNDIQYIDFPPQADFGTREELNLSIADFAETIAPPIDAPSICVIDSGIVSNHPFFDKAVGDATSFPSSMGNSNLNSHGSLVAGIALYGDVSQCIDQRLFAPNFHIFSARVLNSENTFDDEKLIVSQMEDSIRYFFEQYNCRIFNISIGDRNAIFQDGDRQTAWAHILDVLVRELDIVITVSAGNLLIRRLLNEDADRIYQEYPHYLLDGVYDEGDTRIIDPATAANVLTVGSFAQANSVSSRLSRDLDAQPLARDIDTPSPFSRVGCGINDAIKPEICEDGGNMLWRGGFILEAHEQLGVVSLNSDFLNGRLFAKNAGTSFSAPKVAHLAGHILKQYPEASSMLVRALVANSASVPVPTNNLFQDCSESEKQDKILRLCGYGKPNIERAIFSTDYRVTLIAEEEAELNTIQLYQIPIPIEFQSLRGTRRISISLAYNAPVRGGRRDYLGIKMEFKLFRGVSANDLVTWYAEKDDENPSQTTIATGSKELKLEPSITRRSKGTLQKGEWDTFRRDQFEKYIDEDNSFYLLVSCSANAGTTKEMFPNQPYALAVTLEHSDEEIDLYNMVLQRVQTRTRVRNVTR